MNQTVALGAMLAGDGCPVGDAMPPRRSLADVEYDVQSTRAHRTAVQCGR